LGLSGLAFGLASEAVAFERADVRHWLPDLVVGLICIGAGAYAQPRRPGTGGLLAATGFTWFLGNLAPPLLYLHRGPLVHVLITYPGWKPRSHLELAAIAAGYGAAVLDPVWRSDGTAIALAGCLVVFTSWQLVSATGRARRDRLVALQGAVALGIAVAGGAIVRITVPSGDAVEPMLLVYQAVLCGVVVMLAARVRPPDTAAVADLVVELGETRSGTLRDALAATLGDPTLEVGYWVGPASYVDVGGSTINVPPLGGPRAATFVERDSHPFAVLIHDASVLDEPSLVEAVATATRLSATNAALLDEVRLQRDELSASRRRLVLAADVERQRLEARLRTDLEPRVQALEETVRDLASGNGTESNEHLLRAEAHLAHTVSDLHQLARGLHPRELEDGLGSALSALAERCPVPVDVTIDTEDVGSETAAAAFFVSAEALANVAKHAHASRASLQVRQGEGRLLIAVVDDGVGDADPRRGSGLRGLIDRVEALGGRLVVTSPTTGGTRLTAELPLGRQTS
jgi:signal transduction histidine kinase